jgi:hypothetical protein
MNSLDHFLIKSNTDLEKTAFDQTIRNIGGGILHGAGRAMRTFDDSPMLASAVLGAGAGGVHGALTADPEEGRVRKALKSALAGGVAGGITGGALSGAAKGIGRYGRDIEEAAGATLGKNPRLGDVKPGEFADVMKNTVLNPDSRRGGKKLKTVRDQLIAATDSAKASRADADIAEVKRLRKEINKEGGGLGARFNPLETAAMIAGAGVVGSKANDMREKRASVRIREVLDKQASFGALAAKAVGMGAQGAGKAIQMGAANPALAGAAVGAAGGALSAGEGNRLKGALGGAALGAGAGAGMAALAPKATANMARFGKTLAGSGKGAVNIAGKEGATFASAMKPFGALGKTRGNFAKQNITQSIADKGKSLIGNGMSGRAAAGTALAGVGAAGLAGGAATSAMFGSDPKKPKPVQ